MIAVGIDSYIIGWNVENVRGYQKADRCSFFNKVDFLLMIKRAQLI
jgi:hypothetical protein